MAPGQQTNLTTPLVLIDPQFVHYLQLLSDTSLIIVWPCYCEVVDADDFFKVSIKSHAGISQRDLVLMTEKGTDRRTLAEF